MGFDETEVYVSYIYIFLSVKQIKFYLFDTLTKLTNHW